MAAELEKVFVCHNCLGDGIEAGVFPLLFVCSVCNGYGFIPVAERREFPPKERGAVVLTEDRKK